MESWRILREMCADVVELAVITARGGYPFERDRAAAQERDADMKWKRKIIVGLETLAKYVKKHPEAQAAFDELARRVRHPFDSTESESIRSNQTNS